MFLNFSCYNYFDVMDEDNLNSNKKICKIWYIWIIVIDDKFKKEDIVIDEIFYDECYFSD